jgi:hypothetical protein
LCWFKPGSVQRGTDKGRRPLTEHVAGHAYGFPLSVRKRGHLDANQVRTEESIDGVLASEEGTKGRVGEQP